MTQLAVARPSPHPGGKQSETKAARLISQPPRGEKGLIAKGKHSADRREEEFILMLITAPSSEALQRRRLPPPPQKQDGLMR